MKTRLLTILVIVILFTMSTIFIIDNYLVQLRNEGVFKQIMIDCSNSGVNSTVNSSGNPSELRFKNGTHFIDNVDCRWIPNDTFANAVPETETNYSSKLISKSFAIFYATEERGWNEEDFTTYDSHAILLKIKNDGFVFEVDPNTLKEKKLYMNRFNEYDEDQYVWLVSLTENKEYEYHVDAITGKILLATKDGSVVEK